MQTDNAGYRRVDYAKLVVLLTNAVNEQQAMIERQAAEIERLGRDVARLRGEADDERTMID